jgi:NAD(P)-dependent dehydrogenase (short-subunit alcohol dehydrogenase family)
MTRKVWFITGIARGLGHAIAQAALARGDAVIGTTRDGNVPAGLTGELTVLALDMRMLDAVADVASRAAAHHGRLDVVVNNAGYGLVGPVEAAQDDEVAELFRVNVFAPLAVIRAVLPTLRAQKSGHIVNIASVAGIAPGAASGAYSASKAAIVALSQSLAQEVAPFGIWVTSVAPGSFRTDFLSDRSAQRSTAEIADYAAGGSVAGLLAKDGRQIGNPAAAATAILEAVDADEPPLDLLLGSDALQRTRTRLDRFDEDIRRWKDVSLSTDFIA